ncbi:MAG: FAD-binding oxidoreductase, partial [Chlorobiales bacterium]|nr:FAD-binding oxidoreductase [Chlorobiales bacterium]
MTERYDTIIIGAGIIGASIAWHLQNLGARNVAILEKELHPGSGSTCKANGGIRAQFTTEANINMSLLSMDILDEWESDIGDPPVYYKAGYLFVTADDSRFSEFSEAVEFQRKLGVSVSLLDKQEISEMAPYIHTEDIVGGTFGPRDGFVDPGGLCNWLLRRAGANGTSLIYETEVLHLEKLSDGSFQLETNNGNYLADKVVNCAGPHSSQI